MGQCKRCLTDDKSKNSTEVGSIFPQASLLPAESMKLLHWYLFVKRCIDMALMLGWFQIQIPAQITRLKEKCVKVSSQVSDIEGEVWTGEIWIIVRANIVLFSSSTRLFVLFFFKPHIHTSCHLRSPCGTRTIMSSSRQVRAAYLSPFQYFWYF